MSAALSWEQAAGLPPAIAALFGPAARMLLAIPEYQVPLPGGERPSQCDIFALLRDGPDLVALGVEAKVAEPFGPTFADWGPDSTPGRRVRLDAICAMLGLTDRPDASLRYQLFHRTAAAVVAARLFGADRAAMVVQSFAPDHRWYTDFAAFVKLFGIAPPEPGQAADIRLPDGMALRLGWAHSPLPMHGTG